MNNEISQKMLKRAQEIAAEPGGKLVCYTIFGMHGQMFSFCARTEVLAVKFFHEFARYFDDRCSSLSVVDSGRGICVFEHGSGFICVEGD